MDLTRFDEAAPGALVGISGSDLDTGDWTHSAFVPDPLHEASPRLEPATYLAIANARAALAALDSTAQRLPNPTLLRIPTLRREAQSTSALEGTYAPLAQVFTADEESPATPEITEILNYVRMATYGFSAMEAGYPLTPGLLSDMQGILMRATPLENQSGRLRSIQVVVGRRDDVTPDMTHIEAAKFVPTPPGITLDAGVRDLIDWMNVRHPDIDPVVATAIAHYQFETLHPYRDGNGRVGRLLIVLHLQSTGVLTEPTLTVSPWFEGRRDEYYDALFEVSARGDWDRYVRFFARGIEYSATSTHRQMIELLTVQAALKDTVRASALRGDSAFSLIDLAVANPSFAVAKVQKDLNFSSYAGANKVVGQLVDLGILEAIDERAYKRRFYAPAVLNVLVREDAR